MTYSVSGWRDSKVIDAESAASDFSESWAAGWPARPTVRKRNNRRREMQRVMLQYWSQVGVVVKTSPSGVFFHTGGTDSQPAVQSDEQVETSHLSLQAAQPSSGKASTCASLSDSSSLWDSNSCPTCREGKNVYISAPGATFLSWVPSSQTLWTCYDQHHTLSI